MQENEAKEARPVARVPSLRCGQPAVLDSGARRRTRCAAVPLRSNSYGEFDHEAAVSFGTAAAPASALLGTVRRGMGNHYGSRVPGVCGDYTAACVGVACFSTLGATAAHRHCLDSTFDSVFHLWPSCKRFFKNVSGLSAPHLLQRNF